MLESVTDASKALDLRRFGSYPTGIDPTCRLTSTKRARCRLGLETGKSDNEDGKMPTKEKVKNRKRYERIQKTISETFEYFS